MKSVLAKLAVALSGAACLTLPLQAAACSLISVQVIEPDEPLDFREECRAAARDLDDFLARLKQDELNRWDFVRVSEALREGTAMCRKQPELAFELLDKALGSPVLMSPRSSAIRNFTEWVPADYPQERRDEVAIGSWLSSSTPIQFSCEAGYSNRLPLGYDEGQVREWLLKPEYWDIATSQFGNNPARDGMILRQMIDPQSDRFDLARAGELTPLYFAREGNARPRAIDVEVAEALTDARLGIPDYEAAATILSWYSPFIMGLLSEEELERARRLWVRIAQSRLTNPDAQVRRDALLTLTYGDPSAGSGIPFEDVLPLGSQLIELAEWPDGLDPIHDLEWAGRRMADNYPSRALRKFAAGRVELGVLFGPDGTFHSFHVTRSAGQTLDNAAKRGVDRYIRPRLGTMVLQGFEGHYVFVPLPAVEYRLGSGTEGGLDEGSNTIFVDADPRRRIH